MRGYLICLSTAAIVLLHSGIASAGSTMALSAMLDNCQDAKLDPDARIEACSGLIHANLVPHGMLARFYAKRANAYEDKGDLDRAIQDYDKALELKPDFPDATASRALLLEKRSK